MNDIYKQINEFTIDPNVIEFKKYCYSLSFMEILRMTRREEAHSSFLAWLFDSKFNYDLRNQPLELLLDLLINEDVNNNIPKEEKRNLFVNKDNILLRNVEREKPIDNNGRVDIFIQFNIENKKYAIVIENKVEANENIETLDKGETIYQTDKYYNYFKEQHVEKYIYIFLAPSNNGNKVIAHNDNFINISYDDIVRYIIEPLLNNNLLEKTRLILEDYLRTLSKPIILKSNNESSKLVSMLSSEQYDNKKKLIGKIRNKYKDIENILLNGKQKKLYKGNDISYNCEAIKDFINNNKQIIELIWPEITKIRSENTTFAELGLEKGTILYLAQKEESTKRDQRNIYVTIYDDKSNVSYEIDGKIKIDKISNAAQELSGKTYGLRGISWFIYNDGKQDINLFKLNEIKKDSL